MSIIPARGSAPLVRIDFSDDETWTDVVESATRENDDGFCAYLQVIDDPRFAKSDIKKVLPRNVITEYAIAFFADRETMSHPEHPVLCVQTAVTGASFRSLPKVLWSVENNISIANMDFEEFVSAVQPDGIFRGF